jgi:hypothetical protein
MEGFIVVNTTVIGEIFQTLDAAKKSPTHLPKSPLTRSMHIMLLGLIRITR